MTTRRGFLIGLSALVASPAIVRADSLMRLPAPRIVRPDYLTIDQITRDAVRLFKRSNLMMRQITEQYKTEFALMDGVQWGNELRVRLPNQFAVSIDG